MCSNPMDPDGEVMQIAGVHGLYSNSETTFPN
jgi:hypothetical protein